MLKRGLLTISILLLLLTGITLPGRGGESQAFLVLNLEGTVTTGMAQYLKNGIKEAQEENRQGVIILINTPGGLVDATLTIITSILNTSLPVITYVYPSGAIAASAGTFILISGHVAAMTPGTTCGAAMPVTLLPGQEEPAPADDKTINFLAGHMKSIARERDRPLDLVEAFVTENLTIHAQEALREGVVDYLAYDLQELLESLDQHVVSLPNQEVTLNTKDPILITRKMSPKEELAHFISNPQIALILFMIGVYGIIFGLNMPGTYLPETLGLISLLLALFGLGMFAINVVGVLLLILAFILYVAEAFTPTFGILTAMGTLSLVLGAFFLPVEPMLPSEWYIHFQMTIMGMALITALFFLVIVSRLIKLRKVEPLYKNYGMIGYQGRVVNDLDPEGFVRIRGEIWQAREEEGKELKSGIEISVVKKEGVILLVKETAKKT